MKTHRIAALTSVLIGTAVWSSTPASAELLDGTYSMDKPGAQPLPVTVTSCGAGCKRLSINGGEPREYHAEGTTWRCLYGDGLVSTVDNDSLMFEDGSVRFTFIHAQLVKVN